MSGKSIVHKQSLRLPSTMNFLLKGKRGAAVPAAIFFVLFLTLFSLLGSLYAAVGSGNPVNKVTGTLISSKSFKVDAGKYFVSKALETATGDERKLLLEKGPQISGAVTQILGNPIFKSQLDQISNTAYTYYTTNTKVEQNINVKPLLQLALLGLESVDPQFSQLKKELNKIKPIKLQPQTKGPNAAQVKSDFTLIVVLLLLLTLFTLVLYLVFAKSKKGAFRTLGVTLLCNGLVLIVIIIVAGAIIKHQAGTASESLAREAIPIAAHPLTAPFFTLGLLEFLVGLILVVITFLKRVNVNSQG